MITGILIGIVFGMLILPGIINIFIKKFAPMFYKEYIIHELLRAIDLYKNDIYISSNNSGKIYINIFNLKKQAYIKSLKYLIKHLYTNLDEVNLYK